MCYMSYTHSTFCETRRKAIVSPATGATVWHPLEVPGPCEHAPLAVPGECLSHGSCCTVTFRPVCAVDDSQDCPFGYQIYHSRQDPREIADIEDGQALASDESLLRYLKIRKDFFDAGADLWFWRNQLQTLCNREGDVIGDEAVEEALKVEHEENLGRWREQARILYQLASRWMAQHRHGEMEQCPSLDLDTDPWRHAFDLVDEVNVGAPELERSLATHDDFMDPDVFGHCPYNVADESPSPAEPRMPRAATPYPVPGPQSSQEHQSPRRMFWNTVLDSPDAHQRQVLSPEEMSQLQMTALAAMRAMGTQSQGRTDDAGPSTYYNRHGSLETDGPTFREESPILDGQIEVLSPHCNTESPGSNRPEVFISSSPITPRPRNTGQPHGLNYNRDNAIESIETPPKPSSPEAAPPHTEDQTPSPNDNSDEPRGCIEGPRASSVPAATQPHTENQAPSPDESQYSLDTPPRISPAKAPQPRSEDWALSPDYYPDESQDGIESSPAAEPSPPPAPAPKAKRGPRPPPPPPPTRSSSRIKQRAAAKQVSSGSSLLAPSRVTKPSSKRPASKATKPSKAAKSATGRKEPRQAAAEEAGESSSQAASSSPRELSPEVSPEASPAGSKRPRDSSDSELSEPMSRHKMVKLKGELERCGSSITKDYKKMGSHR